MNASDDCKEPVKELILSMLKEKYDIEEEDFLSAELEIVPAGPARDYGLDRSMIMGYGHDDRVCSYTSLAAMLKVENPYQQAAVCLLIRKRLEATVLLVCIPVSSRISLLSLLH